MKRFSFSLFAFFAFVFAVGCKSNSTGPTSAPVVVVPGVGSSYTFYEVTLDSTGATQSTDTTSLVILQKNISVGGYNDVSIALQTITTSTSSGTQTQTDTIYYRFLASGDIMESSVGLQFLFNINWLTIPYGSHTAQNAGNSAPGDTVSINEQYSGQQTLTFGGKTIPMSTVTQRSIVNVTGFTDQVTSTVLQYSPSSGVFGPSRDVSKLSDGSQGELSHQTLLSYSVK